LCRFTAYRGIIPDLCGEGCQDFSTLLNGLFVPMLALR
jgi:hypothetical protein